MAENPQPLARTWANRGDEDPALLWTLKYWPPCVPESEFLTAPQYWHMADQLLDMARSNDPCTCQTVNVEKVSTFWELKDKGGPLGKINLRVFFFVNTRSREIVVLGVHKKEDEDQLRQSVIVRIERRMRHYLENIAPKRS